MHRSLTAPFPHIFAVFLLCAPSARAIERSTPLIIDHTCINLSAIPDEYIANAKSTLHVAYGHTSHGSQIITGMTGLAAWKGSKYSFNKYGTGGALDIRDTPFSKAYDLGNPDRTAWAAATRTYLAANPTVNVVMWSWCGQVSTSKVTDIENYLSLMSGLEKDFPNVNFVYMTGHLDGTGLTGNCHLRNEQIRAYCRANNKILFDFNDIEMYNPDGVYFGDKKPFDTCDYTDGTVKGNWAIEWQNTHTKDVDWYECASAHSQPVNANMKAYAAWWLFARLAGWQGNSVKVGSAVEHIQPFDLLRNHPNPFNASTNIPVVLYEPGMVDIAVYDSLGRRVTTLVSGFLRAGTHTILWKGKDDSGRTAASGVYRYRVAMAGKGAISRPMLYLR